MHIMIAGAGTVGYSLAEILSYKHDIIIVDKDIKRLNKIEENLDILTLLGNIEDPKIYQSFHIKEVDLFIAVTDSDEANLLSTLIVSDAISVKKKIVRLKNSYFLDGSILSKLEIDDAVFPDILTAKKVQALFDFPKANNVKSFASCQQNLISIKVHFDQNRSLSVEALNSNQVRIVGIERDKMFFIPQEETTIQENDLLYIFGDGKMINTLSKTLDCKMPQTIKKVVIFGANASAVNIAKSLLDRGLEIKIVEKDSRLCQMASELLQDKVSIINASFKEHNLFEIEKLKYADMIIAADENDEKNIIKCIEAREYDIEKVVSINNDKSFYGLMHQLGIVVVRGAKAGAHYAILEKIASNTIVNSGHFCGGKAVMFLRKIYPNSKLIGKSIKFPKAYLFYQLRGDKIYTNDDLLPLEVDDTLVLFGLCQDEDRMQKWIYTL